MIDYPWTSRDLLDELEQYQYPPFLGPELLRSYRRQRQGALERLRAEIELPPAGGSDLVLALAVRETAAGRVGTPPPRSPAAGELPADPDRTSFVTQTLLLGLWHEALAGRDGHLRDRWIDRLRGLFERTKRLHQAYAERLRPLGSADSTEPYALLAALLARRCPSRDVRDLNALLKLVDLLTSTRRPFTLLAAHALAGAIEGEGVAMSELLREHEVPA